MYGYQDFVDITPEQLLQKVSQERIFELVFRESGILTPVEPFSTNRKYRSPLREDEHGDCRFEYRKDGTLLFIDFADRQGRTHNSCIGFYCRYYNLAVDKAVEKICETLSISKNSADYLPSKKSDCELPHRTLNFEGRAIFDYNRKDYTKKDKEYYSRYIITIDNLLEDTIYSVKDFNMKSDKGKFHITPFGVCFADDMIDKVKIYQPFNARHKFSTNFDHNTIGFIDNLPATGDRLLITKAHKDARVFKNLKVGLDYTIYLHNEGSIPDMEILIDIVKRFQEIIIFYDNDFQGIRAAYKLYNVLNSIRKGCCKMKYIPIYLNEKDISDYVYKEGRKDTIKFLQKIRLI